jgi:subtilase family serine protease
MAVFAAVGIGSALAGGTAHAATQTPNASTTAPKVERLCSTPAKGYLSCYALKQVNPVEPASIKPNSVSPNATPSGYGPSNLQSAYALPSSTAGSGATVGIVDAQDDPNAESDLAAYRTQYGLPACTTANGCFKKVNQSGATSPLPTADTGWAGEISLDLDMVSAVCPNCHILLVEASSATTANLGTAVNTAVSLGAKYVSNSYGGSEDGSENTYDSSYFNHPGVAITASSGDSDYDGGSYPATSKYVTAVGGTSLKTASNARGWSETVWNTTSYTEGAGSGCSKYVAKPAFQNSISTGCTKRAEADVSAVADPATGLAVYQTYGGSGWAVYGGTSAASPIVASVYALAGTPGSTDVPNTYPYAHTANLNDVTSGSNGTCGAPLCTAGTGWDGPTGLGTPNGVAAFKAGTGGGTGTVTVNNPGSKTGTVGTAASLQLSASGGTGSYTWTATGLPTGLSISSTGLISGTPTTAGTYSVTATAKDGNNVTGSATFSWTISISGGGGGCSSPGQKLGNPGFETGTASPWTASTGVIDNSTGEAAHSGSWKAWLNGYGTTHTDTLSQSVTVPSGCTATFSFWLHIDTAETGTTAYDKLTVKAGSTTLATYSNVNKNTGYVQKSFTVPAGTTSVSFSGVEDSSLQTSFVIDDTALTLS